MQNYKLKQKILKTKPVTYYRANNQSTTETFIIKKLNKNFTWEQILQSKSLTLCKNTKCRYIAKIKEIIKEENSFYCVMDNAEINLTEIIRNDIERKDIYKISRQLIEMLVGLNEENIMVRDIRPSHIFMSTSRGNLKLYHFQSLSEKDLIQLDLTQLQDMRYIAPQEILTKKGYDQRSLVFTIGLIICQLILGQPLINAKNKLQYIYQLTNLFPNDRVDKLKDSQIEFKELDSNKKNTFRQKMNQQTQIGSYFIAFLQEMIKVDYSERIQISKISQRLNQVIDHQENFHKNKEQLQNQKNAKNSPNKNQVNMEPQPQIIDVQFEFQNKPTLSIIPSIFTQKIRPSKVLPMEENVQDDGNQPIVIKQASSSVRQRQLSNLVLKKGFIQKANQSVNNIKLNNNQININSNNLMVNQQVSPSGMNFLNPINLSKNHEALKNSRSTTKQTTTMNTIKKPQLTNYALNEVNLGIKLGMNNTLFSDNNQDHEF